LMAGLSYPYDWGFIPSTKAEDGDPLDVLIIHDAQTYPGVVLRCRPVGVLEVAEEQEQKGEKRPRLCGARPLSARIRSEGHSPFACAGS
jgi:inorganic pyrophosphatase